MKVLISKKTGNYNYYNGVGDFHCKEGFIKEDELKSGKRSVFTNTNREFLICDANNYDLTKKFKRGPQVILAKDLGYIISRTRVNKNSFIVEAGGGSGFATTFFAGIAKSVFSYEINSDNCKVIEKNLKKTETDNVELFNEDLADKVESLTDIDLLFLDMPTPCDILEKDLSCVKSGHYIVCYVPSITQIQEITKLLATREELYLEETSEIVLRHWRVWERVARPEHRKEVDHTAFLVFIRKI